MKKLNNDQEIEILNKYLTGEYTQSLLAKEYNIDYQVIHRFFKQKNINTQGDYSNAQRKYTIDQDFFEKIDTPEKAQVLGLMYSDGYNHLQRGNIQLGLHEKDKEYLIIINNILKSTKPLMFIQTLTKKNCLVSNSYRLDIYSKKMSNDLNSLGCMQKKSLILKFPTDSQVPRQLVKYFILGYIEGDGCINCSKKGNYAIHIVGTKEFLLELGNFIKKVLNVNYYINQKNKCLNKNSYNLQIGGNIQVLKTLAWLYHDSPFYMERKYEKYLILLNKYKNVNQKRLHDMKTSLKNMNINI